MHYHYIEAHCEQFEMKLNEYGRCSNNMLNGSFAKR